MDALSDADLDDLRLQLSEMVEKIVAEAQESEEEDTAESEETRSETSSREPERVICSACRAKSSTFWRRVAKSKIVCNKCFFDKTYLLVFSNAEEESEPAEAAAASSSTNAGGSKDSGAVNGDDLDKEEPFVTVKITRSQAKKYEKFQPKKEEVKVTNEKAQSAEPAEKLSTLRTRKSSRVNQPVVKIKTEELDEPVAKAAKSSTPQNSQCKVSSKKRSPVSSDVLKSIEEIELMETSLPLDERFQAGANQVPNRRTQVFKRETPAPSKSETLTSSICTSEYVFHRGFYMQVGDIVALFDEIDQDQVFFAQIRAFMTDQYGQKSAVLTWLVPAEPDATRNIRTAQDFRVDLFVPGPAEEFPRPLDCMEFVCRLVTAPGVQPGNQATLISRAQYETELLRHKFSLSDEAAARRQLLTTVTKESPEAVTHQIV